MPAAVVAHAQRDIASTSGYEADGLPDHSSPSGAKRATASVESLYKKSLDAASSSWTSLDHHLATLVKRLPSLYSFHYVKRDASDVDLNDHLEKREPAPFSVGDPRRQFGAGSAGGLAKKADEPKNPHGRASVEQLDSLQKREPAPFGVHDMNTLLGANNHPSKDPSKKPQPPHKKKHKRSLADVDIAADRDGPVVAKREPAPSPLPFGLGDKPQHNQMMAAVDHRYVPPAKKKKHPAHRHSARRASTPTSEKLVKRSPAPYSIHGNKEDFEKWYSFGQIWQTGHGGHHRAGVGHHRNRQRQ